MNNLAVIEAESIRHILKARVVYWAAVVESYESRRVGARDRLPLARAMLKQCREMLGEGGVK